MRNELGIEWVRYIQGAAYRLSRVGGPGQLVLLVRNVEKVIFGIGPQAMRFAALRKEAAHHFARARLGAAVNNRDLAGGDAARAAIIDACQACVQDFAFFILYKLNVV